METAGALEAKTHFAALLDRVSKGEQIIITRRGVPAAMPGPVSEGPANLPRVEIVEGMRAPRKRVKPGKMSIKELIEEGRRF
jgi:antitoxin (DNA-binding transcriptional repressor) of toxin-antitoxin stability system